MLAAAIVSVVIGLVKEGFPEGLIEGTSIIIALLIIIVVNSGNNWIAERQLAGLVKLQDIMEVPVLRGSATESITIDSSLLMVGDVYKFEFGQKVPADSLLIQGDGVQCNEAELTGENIESYKDTVDKNNYN